MVRRIYREGATELASNKITASLGNTINGKVEIGGQTPEQMKTQIAAMSDMQKQVSTSGLNSGATPMTSSGQVSSDPREAKEVAINALLGNTDANKLNLDQVEDDQMDLLLANASVLSGAGKK